MGASSDISDAFVSQFVADCERLLRCSPLDLIAVTFAESDCRTWAHNPNGHASGMWQFMPATLRGLGWSAADCDAGLPEFRKLDHLAQWVWFRRYFRPHADRLVSRAACYVATFLPADLELAGDPSAVLVEKAGRRGWAYAPNAGFDRDKDLRITVKELEDAIARAARGPRAADLFNRIRDEMSPMPPKPVAKVEPDVRVHGDEIANANHRAIEELIQSRDPFDPEAA